MTSVIFAGILTIQLPHVQTFVTSKVVESLSEKFDGTIYVEKLHFKPFTTLILKNAVIIDKNPAKDPTDSSLAQIDTFFRAEYIIAKFTLEGLLDKESIKIKMAYVSNAQMNLVLEDRYIRDSLDKHNNLSRIFRIEKPESPKEPSPEEIFSISSVDISNMGFRLINRCSEKTPYHGGINWNDLDVKDIDLHATGLRFKDGIMYGKAESLSFREKSGFNCKSMSGETRVGRGRTIVENLRITDLWSNLHIPLFMMSYRNVLDFNDFIGRVKLDAEISSSTIDFRTITHFAPQLEGNDLKATVSGIMSGCIDDFIVKDIMIRSHAGGFSGNVNGRISGIPDPMNMKIDGKVSGLMMTIDGLGKFVSEWTPDGKLDLSRFGNRTTFKGYASAKGYLNHLNVYANLWSTDGNIKASGRLDEILSKAHPIAITGSVQTSDLNIGNIIDSRIIGKTSISASGALSIDEEISIDMDSLKIFRMNLNNYDYKDILARGKYDSKSFNGTVISKDPNLNFIFQGGYAKSDKSKNTIYKFDASVGHADLNAINIDRRGKSIVQFRTNADFRKTGSGDLLGRVDIGEVMLENRSGRYEIGDIIITSHSISNRYKTRLMSKFADANYSGTAPINDFIKDLKGLIIDNEIPALSSDTTHVWKGHSYNLDFVSHDAQNVLAFAIPGLYIENGTEFNADIDTSGNLMADLKSGRIAFKRNYLKGLNITFDNLDSSINGEMSCDEISAANLKMNNNSIKVHVNDNHIGAGFSFDNQSDLETKGELIVHGTVSGEKERPVVDIEIKPSSLKYNSKEWSIQPSTIKIHDGDIDIDSFGFISGEQVVGIFGRASESTNDLLSLHVERFDLSIINAMLPVDLGIKGAITGKVELKSPINDVELMVDMICDSTYIANVPVGVLKAGTTWDDQNRKFNIFAQNEENGICNLDITGDYTPGTKTVDMNFALDRMKIGYALPFLYDIFSEMDGYMSGNVSVKGPIEKLSVRSSDGMLENARLKVAYTGVPYTANGPFSIDEKGVYFKNIQIKDRFDGTGSINGSINYDHFKDISFDTKIDVNNIEAVNLNEKDGDVFYGSLFGTGNVAITGPVSFLTMTVNASTSKAGQLHIPITSTTTSNSGTNLLKFKQIDKIEEVDPYELFVLRTDKEDVKPSDFMLKLNVNANPDVEAFVEIDKTSGNVLSGRGSGNISLEVSKDIFNINGDYTISSGNYNFVAMGLVSRDFSIQNGSTIRFNGDIFDSSLDINATYRTKASLSTLISDTTSVANRRYVDCGISIKDKLSNPQLSFSIEIPDLDPTIKSRVESALSTEDKVQKQFLSLILSNSFLPDEQSGIVNNSSVLYSNVSEMMANQLNNIFHKLDIPLDLGLNYQPNDRGNDIFDVAVSTQLFNNRVIVNGNIGNRQYSTGNTQNDVVGDIDIEIKLDRSGSFRLNIFSHSADQYTNYLDNSQRNGVGVTYQTEFNTFRQFFRNLFSSKKKRMENKMLEEQAALSEDKIKLDVKPSKQ